LRVGAEFSEKVWRTITEFDEPAFGLLRVEFDQDGRAIGYCDAVDRFRRRRELIVSFVIVIEPTVKEVSV
jgi:hypothetical protein